MKKLWILMALALNIPLAAQARGPEVVLDVEFNPKAVNNPKLLGAECYDGATGCVKGKTYRYRFHSITDNFSVMTWIRVKTGGRVVRIRMGNLDVRFGEHCVHSFYAHLAGETYGCRRLRPQEPKTVPAIDPILKLPNTR